MTISRVGRYEIEKELGHGAMAVVYKANDPVIGRVVAIKTIRLERRGGLGLEELRKRLYREAQSAGGLNHPNIVTIYDIGEEGDTAYIAMEYIEGESLEDYITRYRIPPLEQTLSIIEQVASGLDYAAARGIIHRDIKPGNILLAPDLRPKIADFGIAKIALSELTQTGTVMGTPSYMSPEQAMGKELDGRSDIFSLGVIFYEMLTGERPFTGTSATTIIYKIVHEEPIPPCKLNITLHPGLDAVVGKMLAKDPGRRHQTCGELVQDLRNYAMAGSEPEVPQEVVAPPVPRRRGLLWAALLAVLAAAIGLVGVYIYRPDLLGGRKQEGPVVQEPSASVSAPTQEAQPPPPAITAPVQTRETPPPPQAAEEKPAVPATKEAAVPEKPSRARVRFEYKGAEYRVSVFDGTRRLEELTSPSASAEVTAGEHRFRIVSEEVFLDRPLDRVRLKPDQVYSIALPGTGSAFIEVPNDAYDGCEMLLNGRKLPPPYPAQIQRLTAGEQRLTFRWVSGKYAGKEFTSTFTIEVNRHHLITGYPHLEKVSVQQVR